MSSKRSARSSRFRWFNPRSNSLRNAQMRAKKPFFRWRCAAQQSCKEKSAKRTLCYRKKYELVTPTSFEDTNRMGTLVMTRSCRTRPHTARPASHGPAKSGQSSLGSSVSEPVCRPTSDYNCTHAHVSYMRNVHAHNMYMYMYHGTCIHTPQSRNRVSYMYM